MDCGICRHTDFRAFDHAAQGFRVTAFTDKHHVRGGTRRVAGSLEEGRQMFGNGGLRNRATDIGYGIELKFDG